MSAVPVFSTSTAVRAADGPRLASHIANAVWRADALRHQVLETIPSGWPSLDAQLPGGGWPRRAVTEILAAQPSVLEWRLLSPSLRQVVQAGGQVVVIGPPRQPHLPGLQHLGLNERQTIWIQADAPAERLWTTEQLIKSNAAGAVIAWLPKVRAEHLRRLQVCAQACEGLAIVCRPEAARHESSAAPLRVLASAGLDWDLHVQILKRRGANHDQALTLPSIPGGLASVLTPRLRRLSRPAVPAVPAVPADPEVPHALGRPVAPACAQHATA